MRITIVAVGKKMPAWINQGVEEYSRRTRTQLPFSIIEVASVKRNKTTSNNKILVTEANRIRQHVPAQAYKIALDEKGREFTTKKFSQRLDDWIQDGQDVAFIIGGADGLDPDLKTEANDTWSLSQMTLPHGLVRVLLAEQIYRAWSLLHNHPYHRE